MINEEHSTKTILNLETRLGQLSTWIASVENQSQKVDGAAGFMERLLILDEELRNSQLRESQLFLTIKEKL